MLVSSKGVPTLLLFSNHLCLSFWGSLWGSLLLSTPHGSSHLSPLTSHLYFGGLFFFSLSLSVSRFPRLLSHRIIIRQIRLSAASLHDMPTLACGASPVFTTTPFPRQYRCLSNPSCKIQRPARSASLPPQHPRFSSRPTSLAHSFASRLSPIAFILLFTSVLPMCCPYLAV